jgi:hypothetical protein
MLEMHRSSYFYWQMMIYPKKCSRNLLRKNNDFASVLNFLSSTGYFLL